MDITLKTYSCEICGGELKEIGGGHYQCPYCRTEFFKENTLPNELVLDLHSANKARGLQRFEDALNEYDRIIASYPECFDAYWGATLADYGIQYEKDYDGRMIPTVHRFSEISIYENKYFKNAILYCRNEKERERIKKSAENIEKIRVEIQKAVGTQEPYDIFLCYKETPLEGNGGYTPEFYWASELYIKLRAEGYKVFFAKESLPTARGNYESHIFPALKSARLMLVLTTSIENVESVWVKNEWSRFVRFAKDNPLTNKRFKVIQSGFKPEILPRELRNEQVLNHDSMGWIEQLTKVLEDTFPERKSMSVIDKNTTQTKIEKGDNLEREIFQAEFRRKRNKKIVFISIPLVSVILAFAIVINAIIVPNLKYRSALSLMNEGKYTEALELFEILNGFKDSENKINACNTLIIEVKYNEAIALMNDAKYTEAAVMFEVLGEYKDSSEKANAARVMEIKASWSDIKVGDFISFGMYEQDNNGINGKETIDWRVLDIQDGKALIISKYALNCQKYHESYESVTWEICELRSWLNGSFFDAAFSTIEKAIIPTVTVSADKNPVYSTNPGYSTQDKVFLLSIQEATKYFSSSEYRRCKPTAYAVANGVIKNSASGNCSWWLRSPGHNKDYCAAVVSRNTSGVSVSGIAVNSESIAIRPAIWIDIT